MSLPGKRNERFHMPLGSVLDIYADARHVLNHSKIMLNFFFQNYFSVFQISAHPIPSLVTSWQQNTQHIVGDPAQSRGSE